MRLIAETKLVKLANQRGAFLFVTAKKAPLLGRADEAIEDGLR
jgi:hypothetical protein